MVKIIEYSKNSKIGLEGRVGGNTLPRDFDIGKGEKKKRKNR